MTSGLAIQRPVRQMPCAPVPTNRPGRWPIPRPRLRDRVRLQRKVIRVCSPLDSERVRSFLIDDFRSLWIEFTNGIGWRKLGE